MKAISLVLVIAIGVAQAGTLIRTNRQVYSDSSCSHASFVGFYSIKNYETCTSATCEQIGSTPFYVIVDCSATVPQPTSDLNVYVSSSNTDCSDPGEMIASRPGDCWVGEITEGPISYQLNCTEAGLRLARYGSATGTCDAANNFFEGTYAEGCVYDSGAQYYYGATCVESQSPVAAPVQAPTTTPVAGPNSGPTTTPVAAPASGPVAAPVKRSSAARVATGALFVVAALLV